MRSVWRAASVAAIVLACTSLGFSAGVVSESSANRIGLTRAWVAQVGSPRASGSISHLHIDHDILLAQTEQSLVSAMDPETGRTLWSTNVGSRRHMTSEPAGNQKHIAVVNGSTLAVLNRDNGEVIWTKPLMGVPGAGPAITDTHVFVPMVNGLIEAYEIERGTRQAPWTYKSGGRVFIPPVVSETTVSWTTEKGHLYVVDRESMKIRYRLETRGPIRARPAYWTPHIYSGSTDGCVYAINTNDGRIVWRFTLGDAIERPPVAIEGRVYVGTDKDGMYCLDGASGKQVWHSTAAVRFVSQSPTRVYTMDRLNNLVALDLAHGTRLGALQLDEGTKVLANYLSDRIYLASPSGLVQCLRETALKDAVAHNPPHLPRNLDKARAVGSSEPRNMERRTEPPPPREPVESDEPPTRERVREAAAAADDENPFGN